MSYTFFRPWKLTSGPNGIFEEFYHETDLAVDILIIVIYNLDLTVKFA